MLTKIQLRNMRRFGADGASLDLGALTVLVGPNSSGKSTLIDAVFLACSTNAEEALGHIVGRRVGLSHAARWLIHAPGTAGAEVTGDFADGSRSTCVVVRSESPSAAFPRRADDAGELTALRTARTHSVSGSPSQGEVVFDGKNGYTFVRGPQNHPLPGAWLLDTNLISDDEETVAVVFSEVVGADVAREQALVERLRRAIPALSTLSTLSVLLNADRKGYVAFGNGTGPLLPLAAMGDGGRLLFRIALDATRVRAGSVFLIEEPELHQHPVAIGELTALLIELARSGIQVVISTHSPKLLDLVRMAGQDVASPVDVCIASMTATAGATAIEAIRGTALRTDWTEFAKERLKAFDPRYGGI